MPRRRNKPDTELGNRLVQLRLDHNMSVAELAEKIGRNKSTISRYEDGRTNLVAETIQAYCREFDVNPNYLLGWELSNENIHEIPENRFLDLWNKFGRKLWAELSR